MQMPQVSLLARGRALLNALQQIGHLPPGGDDMNHRIDQPGRPDDLLDHLALAFLELERPRRRADEEHLRPAAIPRAPTDRVLYGLAQPLVGARVLLRNRGLLRAAAVPVGLVAAVCAVAALVTVGTDDAVRFLAYFYGAFAALAPVPSVLLARQYARFAARARRVLGFSPADACLEPLSRSLSRAVKQVVLIALALAPAVALLGSIPGVGPHLVKLAAAVWMLHWIFVDAFDAARFLRPGQTLAELDAHALTLRAPWFVRGLERLGARLPIGGRLVGRFARLCDWLSRPWREEIALVEDHRSLTLGFSLSTAALLALPVLNLLFRPIVIVGAAHVLGRLEELEPETADRLVPGAGASARASRSGSPDPTAGRPGRSTR
jgi:uncharacterized protein involved in cysteine biosynthesis